MAVGVERNFHECASGIVQWVGHETLTLGMLVRLQLPEPALLHPVRLTLKGKQLNSVKVKTVDLMLKLIANRDGHRELFLKAQAGYREAVIKALDKALQDAREGRAYTTYIALQAPEDHTSDYDTVISMLEMSVNETIEIEQHDFQCYVLDKWQWAAHANLLNSTYATGGVVTR